MIFFFKKKNRLKSKLPCFMVKKYVLPQLTLVKYNKNYK